MHDDLKMVKSISERLGAQAVIGVLPISWSDSGIKWKNYRNKESCLISEQELVKKSETVSEFLLIDWKNEGLPNSFDDRIVVDFPDIDVPLIVFGGLSEHEQMQAVLKEKQVAAIAVGNFLNYKEHSVQNFKKSLNSMSLRLADYETKYTLL